jgi:UDP-N-acetylglucosamine 2-epimerase (non-hydrolysing)
MRVMTILGTRPEIIRLSCVIPKLDKLCDHVLINTMQNYDSKLNEIFFTDLGVRTPDQTLQGRTIGGLLRAFEQNIYQEYVVKGKKPDRVLILGDTNSALTAIIAKRMGIPVYHMEAGNRCFDESMPEEVNRCIIDHCSDVLMPYTERSRSNLLREGIPSHKIFVTGNPIFEVLSYYNARIEASTILADLALERGGYFLVSAHRAETVDGRKRLTDLIRGCVLLKIDYGLPIIFSLHPHTAKNMEEWNIRSRDIQFYDPFGFFDFVHLERNARCVITDSGTVQEECSIFKVPNVTIRDTTERPETIECGSNILAGIYPEDIQRAVSVALRDWSGWEPPDGYLDGNVSDKVVNILLGV